MPVAVNWSVSPTPIDALAEVTVTETSRGELTVRALVPLILPWVAVITADPLDFPVVRPLFVIDATAGLETLHVTELLRFWVLPSL